MNPLRQDLCRQVLYGVLATLWCSALSATDHQLYCSDEDVWMQVLGSGDLDIANNRSSAAFLVGYQHVAKVLIDAGSGTAWRLDESNVSFSDLDAILLTQNTLAKTGDLPSLIASGYRSGRERVLRIFGPKGNEDYPSTRGLLERLMGPDGAYSQLAPLISSQSPLGYRIRITTVNASGRSRQYVFRDDGLEITAMPLHHGDVPTLAWRIAVGDDSVVFANDFNNRNNVLAEFAKDTDMLVISHMLPVGVSEDVSDLYVTPSQIGRIAQAANVRSVVLGKRGWRTFGREIRSMETIESTFDGTLIFADEKECWAL